MTTPTAVPAPEARLAKLAAEMHTADDIAQLLQCSVRHVWRMHDAGDLPAAVRVGRLVRWPKLLIATWIQDGCPKRR